MRTGDRGRGIRLARVKNYGRCVDRTHNPFCVSEHPSINVNLPDIPITQLPLSMS